MYYSMSLKQLSQHTLMGTMVQCMNSLGLVAFAKGKRNQKVSACFVRVNLRAMGQLLSATHMS